MEPEGLSSYSQQPATWPYPEPTKSLHGPVLSHIRATRPAHISLLDLITRMIFGDSVVVAVLFSEKICLYSMKNACSSYVSS